MHPPRHRPAVLRGSSKLAREPGLSKYGHLLPAPPTCGPVSFRGGNDCGARIGKEMINTRTHPTSKRVFRALHASSMPIPTVMLCARKSAISVSSESGGPGSLRTCKRQVL